MDEIIDAGDVVGNEVNAPETEMLLAIVFAMSWWRGKTHPVSL